MSIKLVLNIEISMNLGSLQVGFYSFNERLDQKSKDFPNVAIEYFKIHNY